MPSPTILSTVVDVVGHRINARPSWLLPHTAAHARNSIVSQNEDQTVVIGDSAEIDDNAEMRLPDRISLVIVLAGNGLFQISFFMIVSSASAYAEHLGGTATFSGLVIGIPTAFAGLALIPMTRTDKGKYAIPFQFAYAAMFLGNIIYGLAYRSNFLYLILIGRIVAGFGFIAFMYSKRYCSDHRIVGIRRRTTLAGWLVVGQGFGFSAGPFIGGLLYKIGFGNDIFNGYTAPGWVMAGVWAVFWFASAKLFKDVHKPAPDIALVETPSSQTPAPSTLEDVPQETVQDVGESDVQRVTRQQWGVIICMCWDAMTCFFILASWEANIPVFAASIFNYSPYNSGNFIALGGIATIPFLLFNVYAASAHLAQDRTVLALGSSLGLSGLLIMIATLSKEKVTFASFYISWFLVALGFNIASTCTLSLLSKQLPQSWNGKISLAIQYSNYTGRVLGAVWGGAGVKVGMTNYVGLQIATVAVGGLMHLTLWRHLKAKTG